MAGSLTEATWAGEAGRVALAAGLWPIAGGARAEDAGALGWGAALAGTPAPGMARDGARTGGAALALALGEAAGLRTGAGAGRRGCGGGYATARGMGADKTARGGLLARRAFAGVRFAVWMLGNAAGVASTEGAFRSRLDP